MQLSGSRHSKEPRYAGMTRRICVRGKKSRKKSESGVVRRWSVFSRSFDSSPLFFLQLHG